MVVPFGPSEHAVCEPGKEVGGAPSQLEPSTVPRPPSEHSVFATGKEVGGGATDPNVSGIRLTQSGLRAILLEGFRRRFQTVC